MTPDVPRQLTRRLPATLAAALALAPALAETAEAGPGADRLQLSLDQQSRYEWLHQDFTESDREDHALVLRTNLRADMDFDTAGIILELTDSRIYAVDDDTPVNNSMVNPLDILQAYVELGDDKSHVRLGRFTQDLGSRRFMARNRYRNTINAFDGATARWQLDDKLALRAFYSFPVERRYAGDPRDNRPKLDRSHHNQQFGGLALESSSAPFNSNAEVYLLTLNEDDSSKLQTRNRELYSFGARLFRAPSPGRLDHELEALYQTGKSRLTNDPADTNTLDHRAAFVHAELGYQFSGPWQPRLQLHYDYASGDRDPDDDENNGLDSLYGVPRGDFGPTGIYRILVRSNISSPALRLELAPAPRWKLNMELRDARLATNAAASPTNKLQPGTRLDNKHLGHQLEVVLRWQAIPQRLRLETGTAWFHTSAELEERGIDDKAYLYFQVNLNL